MVQWGRGRSTSRRPRLGEATRQRDRVPAQGAHVRALLADPSAGMSSPTGPVTGSRSSRTASCDMAPEPACDPALDVHCARSSRRGLRRRLRRAAVAACGGTRRHRHRAVLRPRVVGPRSSRSGTTRAEVFRRRGMRRKDSMNRALDVAIAGIRLVVTTPLLAAGALAVKLEDQGQVLYRQTRVGKDGVDFELLEAQDDDRRRGEAGRGLRGRQGDWRITKVGRVLRRISVTSCRSSGTWCAVTCRSSARGRRCATRSNSTTRVSCIAWTSSRYHRLGSSIVAHPCPRPSASSSTSGTCAIMIGRPMLILVAHRSRSLAERTRELPAVGRTVEVTTRIARC